MKMLNHTVFPITLISAFALALTACGGDSDRSETDHPWMKAAALGGDTTNMRGNQSSFGFDVPAANLAGESLALHLQGDAEFEVKFIRAPSEDFSQQDGLGPVFNNDSCNDCHARDGRGNYSLEALQNGTEWTQLGTEESVFLRISIDADSQCESQDAANDYCAPIAVPGYSDQLFHRGLYNLRGDGSFTGQADVYVRFEKHDVTYADGTSVSLSKPVFELRNPYDMPGEKPADNMPAISRLLQDDVATSPRMGMPMFGLGLLEAIPEADILALADPDDANGDGISGRANYVYDPQAAAQGASDPVSLGRFGWKAGTPSVHVQGSGAYRGDMGITNYLFPEESIVNTPLHDTYLASHPLDDGQQGAEIGEEAVKAVMFYANTLAVPGRRNVDDPNVIAGARLFESTGCTGCHTPSFTTAEHPGIWGPSGIVDVAEVEHQKIYPFTDMLLHDMGEGLADNRTEFLANGREWKTRPLWGIGLTHTVNPLAGYLHDGRARTLEEAILWHGGEAEASKESFRQLSRDNREALLSFLESL